MPLAGIRTRLRLSASSVAYCITTNTIIQTDRHTVGTKGDTDRYSTSVFLKLSVFYSESELCLVECRQTYRGL